MVGAGRIEEDRRLFGTAWVPTLRAAAYEFSWLLSHGYPERSALKLVGDRHALNARQRKAVQRCACTEAQRRSRAARRISVDRLRGGTVAIDGFNCLIICESLASGRVTVRGRDAVLRDLAGVHGSWRKGPNTFSVVDRLVDVLDGAHTARVDWILDRPVANSGRLAALLRDRARRRALTWHVELVEQVDEVLADRLDAVATADAWVLDRCHRWIDLPQVVAATMERPWIVDLDESP